MVSPLRSSALRVQEALDQKGVRLQVIELPDSTRTAVEAAQAVGCEVGQIAKSLVFQMSKTLEPLLVIASGKNRVDEKKVEGLLGQPIHKADADFVREQTGFVIGGIPPVGHQQPLRTLIDADLLSYETIWAAAGTPFAVFKLTPSELLHITGGQVGEIKK